MCAAVVDEQSKREIKEILLSYDRTLLVADPRRCEPKKCASMTLIWHTRLNLLPPPSVYR